MHILVFDVISPEGCLGYVLMVHMNLIEACPEIYLAEVPRVPQLIENINGVRERVAIQWSDFIEWPKVVAESQVSPVTVIIFLGCTCILTSICRVLAGTYNTCIQHLLDFVLGEGLISGRVTSGPDGWWNAGVVYSERAG